MIAYTVARRVTGPRPGNARDSAQETGHRTQPSLGLGWVLGLGLGEAFHARARHLILQEIAFLFLLNKVGVARRFYVHTPGPRSV